MRPKSYYRQRKLEQARKARLLRKLQIANATDKAPEVLQLPTWGRRNGFASRLIATTTKENET